MKQGLRKIYELLKAVAKGYLKDDCSEFAAVISFYAIFSLLPLTLITVSVMAYLLGTSSDLIVRFQALIEGVIPAAADELFLIMKSALEKKQRMSLISAGILIVVASFLFTSLEHALDRVFRAAKKRNFLHSRVVAIGFIFVFILLFAAPGIVSFVQSSLLETGLIKKKMTFVMSGDVFFFFVAFGAFFLSTTFIPHPKVFMRYALVGAVFFTFLTGVARLVFREYIELSWSRYDFIYDSLTVLIVLIIWIYYIANIFLLSAELVARLQEGRLRSKRKA